MSMHTDTQLTLDDDSIAQMDVQTNLKGPSDLREHLRLRDIQYVRAEYRGREGHGRFVLVQCSQGDGRCNHVLDGQTATQVTALFLAVLTARHPDWCRGEGSCGDFRWFPARSQLTHSHYVLGMVERITHHGFES